MEFTTNIISNGSKWYGEEPDSIEKLLEVLQKETIEETFFQKWVEAPNSPNPITHNFCPINKKENGFYVFFGDFEGVSHVFNIETNDPSIIKNLSEAIKSNKGWALYYRKNKY